MKQTTLKSPSKLTAIGGYGGDFGVRKGSSIADLNTIRLAMGESPTTTGRPLAGNTGR